MLKLYIEFICAKTCISPAPSDSVIGIAVGVAVATIVSFVLLPIVICILVWCYCANRSVSRPRVVTAVQLPMTSTPAATEATTQTGDTTKFTYPDYLPPPPYSARPEQPPGYPAEPYPATGYPPQQAYPPGQVDYPPGQVDYPTQYPN